MPIAITFDRRKTFVEIDGSALQHNLVRVNELAPNSSVNAMIKSNGYGHGLVRTAKALNKADAFGVAFIDEALCLREAGIKQPILLMEGFLREEELAALAEHQLQPVLHHPFQLALLSQAKLTRPLKVWLKFDSGMHRLGFTADEFQAAYKALNENAYIEKPIGLMTHFANADDAHSDFTEKQIQFFNDVTKDFKGPKSLSNSAGVLAWQQAHGDWVRPGIMLFGASPMLSTTAVDYDLKPAMTLCSEVIAVKHLNKGDCVGYGSTWQCPENMQVGVVAIGYGDGYPRHAKNGTPVLINNNSCKLIGRVSMDMISVDLRNAPATQVGDKVVLWGKGLPIEKVAEAADTISYELLCKLTGRVTGVPV